jgi:hypothetical protein
MGGLYLFAVAGTAANQSELIYIWDVATPEAKAIIACLFFFHRRVVGHDFEGGPDAPRKKIELLLRARNFIRKKSAGYV